MEKSNFTIAIKRNTKSTESFIISDNSSIIQNCDKSKNRPYTSQNARAQNSKACGTFHRKYHLLDELGRGGYGFVYRCIEKKTRQIYAVKMNFDPTDKHNLKEEYKIIDEICHPSGHVNIVNVICCIEDDQVMYNIYELASGGDLKSHLRRKVCAAYNILVEVDNSLFFINIFIVINL